MSVVHRFPKVFFFWATSGLPASRLCLGLGEISTLNLQMTSGHSFLHWCSADVEAESGEEKKSGRGAVDNFASTEESGLAYDRAFRPLYSLLYRASLVT